jgi:hypothetical protein
MKRHSKMNRKIKTNTVLTLSCFFFGLTGCSKKNEECTKVLSAIDTYKKSAAIEKSDTAAKPDAASLLADAKASETTNASIQTLIDQLKAFPITDEQLLSHRKAAVSHFEKNITLVKEWAEQSVLAAKTEKLGIGFNKALEKNKSDIDAACNKKERKRRTRQKQKRACKEIDAHLNDLSLEALTEKKIDDLKPKLKSPTSTYNDLKSPVDQLIGTLDSIEKLLKSQEEVYDKLEASSNRVVQHQSEFEKLEKNIKSYCTAE